MTRFLPGGGQHTYGNYSAGAYEPEDDTGAVLSRTTVNNVTTFTLTNPDGSTLVYGEPDGAASGLPSLFLSSVVDPQGNALTFTYGTSGSSKRLTTITDAMGRDTTFAYAHGSDPLLVTSITDPFGRSATLAYNGSFYLSSITDVLGIQSSFSYTSSFINTLTTPYGNTTFAFTESGTNPVLSRTLTTTDPLSKVERLEYQRVTSTSYVSSTESGAEGRVTKKKYDDTTDIDYTYGVSGRLLTATDQLLQVKTYGYDKADDVTGITYTSDSLGTGESNLADVTFTYHAWYPRRTQMTDAAGTTNWTYVAAGTDGAGQVDTEIGPFAQNSANTVDYDYDNLGRVKCMKVSGETCTSTAEEWTYSNVGRVDDHVTKLGTFAYEDYLAQTSRPKWRTLGGSSVTLGWVYDEYGNSPLLTQLYTQNSQGRSFALNHEIVDGEGTWNWYDIQSIEDLEGETAGHPWAASLKTWAYTYDDNDRLTQGDDGTTAYDFTLDDAGNATSFDHAAGTLSLSYGGTNNISTSGYTYSTVGESTADNGTRTYIWDIENRLWRITQGGNTTTFLYDGLGRRVQTTYSSGSVVRRYQWCGNRICSQKDGSDTLLKRYYEEGEFVVSGSVKLLTMKDQVGSVRDVMNTSGTLQWGADYTPYGEFIRTTGSGRPDFLFAGLFYDANTGLYYSNTRAYDPKLGRWISRDPIAEEGGLNLYEYGASNPVTNSDPSGLKVDDAEQPGADAPGTRGGIFGGGFHNPINHPPGNGALRPPQETAISPYRYTAPGESFTRYESGNSAFSRVTQSGGLTPGTYAAPAESGILPQGKLPSAYNLPNSQISRGVYYNVTPPEGTPVIGPRPVSGGTGSEVLFPNGVPPGSVSSQCKTPLN